MKTLILSEPGNFSWKESPEPTPQVGEALVRVLACGVCGTDIHAYSGQQPFFSYPRRLGHELAVEVIQAPEGSRLKKGDRCAVEAYYFCGDCPACLAGKTNCCQSLQVLGVHIDGGHTPFMTVPADKLHVSLSLTPDQLALVEPLVIGAHAVERANPKRDEPTVVIGAGPIGLAVALFCKARGANLVCVDLDADRLSFASQTMHLGTPITGGDGLKERLLSHFGKLPSIIIDATGNKHSMDECFELVEHGGAITFVGLFMGDLTINDPNFHRRELTLMASRAGSSSNFREVIEMIESEAIDPLPMITHRFAFADAAEQLPEISQKKGLVKAMIKFP